MKKIFGIILVLLAAVFQSQAAPQAVMYDPATGQYIITGVSTSANLSALTGTFTNPTAESMSVTNWFQKTGAASWDARCLFGSVVFSNKIWIIGGGLHGGDTSFSDVWSSSNGSNWIQEASSQSWGPRSQFACMVHSNRMWICGGYGSGFSVYNDIWSSTNGVTWVQVTNSAEWSGRYGLAGCAYSNKLWVMGGRDTADQRNDVWSSTDGSNWTQVTSGAGWAKRYYHSVFTYDNKMWVLGGSSDAIAYNDVWYSTDGTNWTQATADAGWETRYRQGAVTNAGKIYVYGGYAWSGGSPYLTNDMWSSTDGASWTEVTNSCGWSKRYGMGCPAFDNKMWTIGGYDGSAVNDVWYYGASLSYPAGSFDGTNVIWNVGLGAKMFVYQSLATEPVPLKGAVYFNSASNIFFKCTNGTSWTAF